METDNNTIKAHTRACRMRDSGWVSAAVEGCWGRREGGGGGARRGGGWRNYWYGTGMAPVSDWSLGIHPSRKMSMWLCEGAWP